MLKIQKSLILALVLFGTLGLFFDVVGAKGKSYGHNKSQYNKQQDFDKDSFKNNSGYRLDSNLVKQIFANDNLGILPASTRSSLLKQKQLPPGIRKNLMRGKPLPSGIAKKFYNLPPTAYSYLGVSPSSYRLGVAGRNVILYDITAGIVRDILFNAF